ncbi:CDI toxin immunity protein [Bacillus toyonensis]|uniref:CDI toxin immunity protein n=1 Tax=Bacillus toyonensis TaxID=155322 RepID=UPI003F649F6E
MLYVFLTVFIFGIQLSIDDVTEVSFDTWIYAPHVGYTTELYHDGDIRIGLK